MEKKFPLLSPIVLVMIGGAILGLVSTIILILSNPSRFPQSATPNLSSPTATVLVRETSETGKEQATNRAKKSLSQQLKIDGKNIEVASAGAVNWPDTSLGCPQPGRFYAQTLTPGYRVVLKASGQEYDYHADASEQVFLCTQTGK